MTQEVYTKIEIDEFIKQINDELTNIKLKISEINNSQLPLPDEIKNSVDVITTYIKTM